MRERAREGLDGIVVRLLTPGLIAASALLLIGHLLSVYDPFPTGASYPAEQTQLLSLSLANYLTLQQDRSLYITVIPLVVLALLGRLDHRFEPSGSAVRRAGVVVATAAGVVGLALAVGTVAWVAVTAGYVTVDNIYSSRYEPVRALVAGVGNGLAAAVLAGLAAWLLSTPEEPTDEPAVDEAALDAVGVVEDGPEAAPTAGTPDPTLFRRPGSDGD